MVMKKEEMNTVGTEQQTNTVSNTVVCVVVVAAVLVLIVLVRCRRKKNAGITGYGNSCSCSYDIGLFQFYDETDIS